MIHFNLNKYEPGVVEYLNGYPAFRTVGSATIDGGFYSRYIKYLAYYSDPNFNLCNAECERIVKDLIDRSEFTEEEFSEYIKPVIQQAWACAGSSLFRGKVTMEMAQAFLRFIEPYWCEYKGIRSTGYIKADNSIILDDDMFDI